MKYKIKPTGIPTNILNVEFGLFKDKFGKVLNLVNTPQNTLALSSSTEIHSSFEEHKMSCAEKLRSHECTSVCMCA